MRSLRMNNLVLDKNKQKLFNTIEQEINRHKREILNK